MTDKQTDRRRPTARSPNAMSRGIKKSKEKSLNYLVSPKAVFENKHRKLQIISQLTDL